ncbi:MAG: imidazolonepropionase [Acidobacteriota bacterium]
MKADLVIANAGQMVTCRSNGKAARGAAMRDVGIIEDGAVAVHGDKIVEVGRTAAIISKYQDADVIDAAGKVVCPGFVDAHTHIVFAGDRLGEFELKIGGADYLEILKNGGGILSTVARTREASRSELSEQTLRRLEKMLAAGTTTAEIKSGYGLNTETELKMLAVIEDVADRQPIGIVPTFLAAHTIPPEFKNDPDGYVDLICDEMLSAAWEWYRRSSFFGKVPFFADVFCEKGAFSLEQSRRVLIAAKEIGFAVKAHVDEFTNLGGSGEMIKMNAVSIDHLDAISDDEVAQLAGSETVAVATPAVNFNLGSSHFADARKIIDAGAALALSTDYNPGSAPCPSMTMAMAIACRYQKLLPSEAFNASTINGAFAVGLGDRIGSIETAKQADIIILDTHDYREAAYEFGGSLVTEVFKAGRSVFRK